nr:aldolase catalytic domain-containing protein [uncultured Draconibacterium sp.]
MNTLQICDCTLRDGGYYTNWDFDQNLVETYFEAMNDIPAITHLEIGYRSLASGSYLGEYFYCPDYVLKMAREMCPDKTLAIMLNEKDTSPSDLDDLLNPCKSFIDLVRIAVDPKNMERALVLAKAIKAKGFQMGFNIMYMSQWANDTEFINKLNSLEGNVDYIYLVDSFGGVYPEDVKKAVQLVKEKISIPLGFHGHNNMELGLANSLVALENGCQVVDATITGMGRGAGNLKTELLLTCLNAKGNIQFDFNKLTTVVADFEKLQSEYKWGTNLPYMISGAYSLPQKEVMSWISKRRFTTESIINALQNKKDKIEDNHNLEIFSTEFTAERVVIIGGGSNSKKHAPALIQYCKQNPDVVLIHAGVRFVKEFNKLENRQYFCLLGSEGNKLKKDIATLDFSNIKCILEPSPRKMGTILPKELHNISYELKEISFIKDYPDSLLTIALQLAIDLSATEFMLFGFDGYDMKSNEQMIEVSAENQLLIDTVLKNQNEVYSLLPTKYSGLKISSIYRFL